MRRKMFEEDKNNIEDLDFSFRAMMEEAQEPVPAHVWDRIESGLDKAARRRTAVLWFRRAAVGVAAAAAVAIGLFFGNEDTENIVNPVPGGKAVAMAEPQKTEPELLAMAVIPEKNVADAQRSEAQAPEMKIIKTVIPTEEEAAAEAPAGHSGTEEDAAAGKPAEKKTYAPAEKFPDVWPDDGTRKKKNGISIVVSGITGTNGDQNSMKMNPMKRPGISSAPQKTGIKETSTNTTYGIPVSAGLGVRFDIAPRWSLGVGINYTLLTRKFYGTYTQIGTDGSIMKDVSSDIRNSQHYLGIPVNAYYSIVNQDRINFYAYAGGAVEKCLEDRYQVLSTDIVHKEKASGVQLSTNLGLGVEFMLGKHLGLYIDPSVRYYFDCGQPKSIRTAQPLMLGFEMGFRARL